jgi:hypothetical protein
MWSQQQPQLQLQPLQPVRFRCARRGPKPNRLVRNN